MLEEHQPSRPRRRGLVSWNTNLTSLRSVALATISPFVLSPCMNRVEVGTVSNLLAEKTQDQLR